MKRLLGILGVAALVATVPVGISSVSAQEEVTPQASGTFCSGVFTTLGAFEELAGVLNLEGFGAFAAGGFLDPTLWPEGFPPGSADVSQTTLDALIGAIQDNWAIAFDNKGDVPADVEASFDLIYNALETPVAPNPLSAQDALALIVSSTWATLSTPPSPADPPATIGVAGAIAGPLAALADPTDPLGVAFLDITTYIEDTGCVTPGPAPVDPGDDVAAFCTALLGIVEADFAAQIAAILTPASVEDPSLVDNDALETLLTAANNAVLAGDASVPATEAANWRTVTGGIADLYDLLASYEWDWSEVLEPVRAALVDSLNSTTPDPVIDGSTEALTTWYLANCLEPAVPEVTPAFTG